jgi:hypothetical protein
MLFPHVGVICGGVAVEEETILEASPVGERKVPESIALMRFDGVTTFDRSVCGEAIIS